MIRLKIILYGKVQNVGLRTKVMLLARLLRLSGQVKNLPDGTVELEIQGKEKRICQLFDTLKMDLRIDITDMKIERILVKDNVNAFTIIR